jgi:hypothetical protein
MIFFLISPNALAMAMDSRTSTKGIMIAEDSSLNASGNGRVWFW